MNLGLCAQAPLAEVPPAALSPLPHPSNPVLESTGKNKDQNQMVSHLIINTLGPPRDLWMGQGEGQRWQQTPPEVGTNGRPSLALSPLTPAAPLPLLFSMTLPSRPAA